jgi:hypothetical protein
MLWLYALVPAESETPGTQITSTITSSYMITITSSCRPDVADCPDGTVTQYGCGDMECSLVGACAVQSTFVISLRFSWRNPCC